ncbi:YbaN family protein [Kaarinaea lacus]
MRLVYIGTGILSLILGFIGIFLPVLPTTPFILLSGFCFGKSSPRLYLWLVNNKFFGPIILEWQHHRSMPRNVKKRAIFLIITTFSVTIIFFIDKIYLQFLLVFVATVLITYIARIPSRDTVIATKASPD